MAGIIVKKPLADKETVIGKVVEVLETSVILEYSDGKKGKHIFPAEVLETINEDHNGFFGGDIIKITLNAGEYEIEEIEEFPKG